MERFTERDTNHIPGIVGINSYTLYDNKYINEYIMVYNTLDKLADLEDIEEELGINLITLFKALKNGIYIIESNDGYIVEDCIRSIEHFKDGWGIVTNNEELELMMSDYGKTWALTREELEEI